MKALEMHDRRDLKDWLFLFDANGEIISSHRGLKLNATEVRMAVRYASRTSPVDAVAVFHSRQLESHQIRAAVIDVANQDNSGLVIRGNELIWSDPSHKDAELLKKSTAKGG